MWPTIYAAPLYVSKQVDVPSDRMPNGGSMPEVQNN